MADSPKDREDALIEEQIARYESEEAERWGRNIAFATKGVVFADIKQAYIDETVRIGAGTYIGPCVTLKGNTTIGENCHIGQNSRLEDATIADEVVIESSVVLESSVGERTKVGPFAYLRPGSTIGRDCKVGDFVEIKNSSLGDGSKAAHLTYVGDSDVGKGVNLGCGVVFVNYDGKDKHRSVVKDGAFIGCNVNLISPVTVEENAYIAAGATVTGDVPAGALHVARPNGKNIEGWVERRGLLKKKEK